MPDEDILHQEDVEDVVADVIEAGVGHDRAAIADLGAAGGGYVQAEHTAVRTTINSILAALRANGIILP